MTNASSSHMRMNLVLTGIIVIAGFAFAGTSIVHADGHSQRNECTFDGNSNVHHHPNQNPNDDDSSTTPVVTGGTLTIEKDTIDGNGTFSFNVTDGASVNQDLSLTTSNYLADSSSISLAGGSYAVTEAPTDGWYLADTTCENADGVIGTDITNAGVQIDITDGEDVTCAFTNVFETAPVATSTATSTDTDTSTTTPSNDDGGTSSTTPVVTTDTSSGGSSGSGGHTSGVSGQFVGGGNSSGLHPEVLGASIGPSSACIPPLTSYLREGQSNDPAQVKSLQTFLNQQLGLELSISGIFDASTTQAVEDFQLKYANDVLAPWVPYGLPNAQTPTGYVYKLTEWKVNEISCPDNGIVAPKIP